jgi:hypothetical protein
MNLLGHAMRKTITWGAIVGVALGATITFALAKGWLPLPASGSAAAQDERRASHSAVIESPAIPEPSRPLRPGGVRLGEALQAAAGARS